jgi:probable HAF family extracellular repeat protein
MHLGRRGLTIHAVMGLAAGLLGADRAQASPYYTVQDLGVYSQTDALGFTRRINVDSQGNVSFAPYGGLIFNASATRPVPAGDQPYYTVAMSSDNGLYTAGRAYDPTARHMDGYLVSNGHVTLLSPLDPSNAYSAIAPYAVNNAGQVVGDTTWADSSGAFVGGAAIYTPGQGSQLIAPVNSLAYGINNLGQVVGELIPQPQDPSQRHAFLWNGAGQLYDLNTLIATGSGWTLTAAMSINDKGLITAYGTDASGQYHALLLTPTGAGDLPPAGSSSGPPPTPTPELSTLTFAVVVILGLAARRARGR